MRLACPACQAQYDVPDTLLGQPGRRLRCARCATEFVASPAPPTAEPRPESAPPVAPPPPPPPTGAVRGEARPSRVSQPKDPPHPSGRRRGPGAAVVAALWLASLAVIGGAGAGCYVWRASVMAAWPPSQRVYAAFGMR